MPTRNQSQNNDMVLQCPLNVWVDKLMNQDTFLEYAGSPAHTFLSCLQQHNLQHSYKTKNKPIS